MRSTDRPQSTSRMPYRARRRPSEADQLQSRWGVASCHRCGRTIVMGEPFSVRPGAPVVCQDCLDSVPEKRTFTPAPARLQYAPVLLVETQEQSEAA
ncbi:MAG TPA: hypothetical protein VK576_10430 [Thermoleophilia bacterium]|nr:hypothetical protein [Thermoleophilia bacterium]